MNIIEGKEEISRENLLNLYNSVGWSSYTDDIENLEKAIQNSSYVVCAYEEEELVGLARSISDDVSIHYLQDILIKPENQRKGIARKLLNLCLSRFSHVRTHMILTDDEEKQKLFYESIGYKNTRDLKEVPLNSFVKMNGIELS